MVYDSFGEAVTEERWHKAELCIEAFAARWPRHWKAFKDDLAAGRTQYQEAFDGELRKAQWRNTAAFPVVYRRAAPDDEGTLTGQGEEDLVQVASLLDPLKLLLPGIIDPDRPGKPNKVYRAFLKRFPAFMPGESN